MTPERAAAPSPAGDRELVRLDGLEAVLPTGDGVGPLSLTIREGERVLLIGPSGSGKTTVLHLLHGAVPQVFDARLAGSVRVVGLDPARAPVHAFAGAVGVVMQSPEDSICLERVDEEIALPLESLGVPAEDIPAGIDDALSLAGASHLRERSTTGLSGGELQRVGLAAGLAGRPRLLLLDEPTSMLDAAGVRSVSAAVDAAARRLGAAVVLVEHRLDELSAEGGLADLPARWLVLDASGRVAWDGPVASMPWGTVRELLAAGCWLPADLELHALLGGYDDAAPVGADLAPSLDDPGIRAALAQSDTARPALPASSRARPARAVVRGSRLAVAAGRASGRRARRESRAVLTGVDLELHAGELVCVVGANGAGKSSLLLALAGLSRPAAGTLEAPPATMVFQDPEHQFARATVLEEAAHGLPRSAIGRVHEALDGVGLGPWERASPFRLSGGQKRLLSLVSVLLHDRPLVCADEPTFGLDRAASVSALRLLRRAADAGSAVLMATHDLRAVATWADRVLVLGEGQILLDDGPGEVLARADLLERAGLRPPRIARELDRTALEALDAALDELAAGRAGHAGRGCAVVPGDQVRDAVGGGCAVGAAPLVREAAS